MTEGCLRSWCSHLATKSLIAHLHSLVEVLAEEFNIDLRRLGSTTFKREDIQKGFEADSCFYIQNASAITDKDGIDLMIDPPPDLIIEVDITSKSLDRSSIFASVGVSEVWRTDCESVAIYRLEGPIYIEADCSGALPALTPEIASRILRNSRQMTSTAWLRSVREWARTTQG